MAKLNSNTTIPEPNPNTPWAKGANMLASAWRNGFIVIADLFADTMAEAVTRFLDSVEPHLLGQGKGVVDKILNNPSISPEVKAYLQSIEAGQHQTDGIVGTIVRVGMTMLTIFSQLGPYNRLAGMQSDRNAHSGRLGASDIIASYRRGTMDSSRAADLLAEQGFTAEYIPIMLEISRQAPQVAETLAMMNRGMIDRATAKRKLLDIGYNEQDSERYLQLAEIIPGIQDIISMAVKEAFTPDIAARFGQYQDFPEDFAVYAAKQGLTREWAQRYWAAHWSLPSPGQGFEMLQRRIINNDDLVLLLKALDIMPYWRDKLIQLNYSPYTRVDVRRMYNAHVLTEADVLSTYQDLGYNLEHATKLTEFTTADVQTANKELTKADVIQGYEKGLLNEAELRKALADLKYDNAEIDYYVRYAQYEIEQKRAAPDKAIQKADLVQAYKLEIITVAELTNSLTTLGYDDKESKLIVDVAEAQKNTTKSATNRELAKSEITSAYVDRLIGRGEAESAIVAMGYDASETDFILSLADYRIAQDNVKMVLDGLHLMYINGDLTENELVGKMGALNLPGVYAQNLQYRWALERQAHIAHPTLSQLQTMFKKNVIGTEDVRTELSNLGYSGKYMEWFMTLITEGSGNVTT